MEKNVADYWSKEKEPYPPLPKTDKRIVVVLEWGSWVKIPGVLFYRGFLHPTVQSVRVKRDNISSTQFKCSFPFPLICLCKFISAYKTGFIILGISNFILLFSILSLQLGYLRSWYFLLEEQPIRFPVRTQYIYFLITLYWNIKNVSSERSSSCLDTSLPGLHSWDYRLAWMPWEPSSLLASIRRYPCVLSNPQTTL